MLCVCLAIIIESPNAQADNYYARVYMSPVSTRIQVSVIVLFITGYQIEGLQATRPGYAVCLLTHHALDA